MRSFSKDQNSVEPERIIDNKQSPKISISINFDSQNAKYEGKKLEQPVVPRNYKVKLYVRDETIKSTLGKLMHRSSFIVESFLEYLRDIRYARWDAIIFKSAELLIRTYNRVRHVLEHGIYEIKKIVRGFKKLKNDVQFLFGVE